MQQLSLAITNYNRYELTIKSFEKVLNNDRIGDILILDDASTDGSFEKLNEYFKDEPKVRLVQQVRNRGMQRNKRDAVAYSYNDWVILLDSDNELTEHYIEHIPEVLEPKCIYMPSWAMPRFDYRQFQNILFDSDSVKQFIGVPFFGACLNTCNYVCHKETYINAFEYDSEILEADTINHLYNHLKKGGTFTVVEDMWYNHLVHDESGFMKNVHKNMADAMSLEKKIKLL